MVTDEALCAGVRRSRGDARLVVRVESRTPLSSGLCGSGARFERVRLAVEGRARVGVLKRIEPDPICVTRERRFYEELAADLPARIPRLIASGEREDRVDGWVLLEEFPGGERWRPSRALGRVGDRAAVLAAWRAIFSDFERRAAALLG